MANKILIIIVLVIAYIVLAPIAVLMGLNTLFPVLNIPVNFDTWCSIVVLGTFIRSTTTVNK